METGLSSRSQRLSPPVASGCPSARPDFSIECEEALLMSTLRIVPASESDVPLILEMILGLADYEKLTHTVVATEEQLRKTLFGPRPAAEVLLAYDGPECAGFEIGR